MLAEQSLRVQSGCHLKSNKKVVPFCREGGPLLLTYKLKLSSATSRTCASCWELQKRSQQFLNWCSVHEPGARGHSGGVSMKWPLGMMCSFKRGDRRGSRVWRGGCLDASLDSPQPRNSLRHEYDYLPTLQGRKQEAQASSKARQQGCPLPRLLHSAGREKPGVSERSSPRGLLFVSHFIWNLRKAVFRMTGPQLARWHCYGAPTALAVTRLNRGTVSSLQHSSEPLVSNVDWIPSEVLGNKHFWAYSAMEPWGMLFENQWVRRPERKPIGHRFKKKWQEARTLLRLRRWHFWNVSL